MKQKLLNNFRLRALILVAILCAGFTSAWADTKTDVLNQSWTGVSGTSYSAWTNKKSVSDAVYAGQSAGGNSSIQLRSNNSNSGVVTTTSGGKVKSITVEWQSGTTNGRTLNVYGKNSAYSDATDLYNTSNQGTLLGTIVCGTSTSLTISDDYEYIGFRSANGAMYLTSVSIEWETDGGSGSSAVATTTTIDESGITNTDVYTSTVAGTLSATVTAGENAVTGATVTWSGNNDDVATIDEETGEVTLVAAGSVTFTATYAGVAGTYQSSTDTYEMTVTSSAPYVQPTEFFIALNNTLFGTNYNGSASGITDTDPISGTQDNVTVTYAGSGNHYVNNSQIRFYPNNNLTFEAPSGYVITGIVFTSAGTWAATISANSGEYDITEKTWTGEAESVQFIGSGSSRCDMSKVAITLAAESTDPSITASNVNIAYDATEGSFDYTINNPVEGGVVSVDFESDDDWLLTATESNGTVSFTCTANATNAEREAVVQIAYTYNNGYVTKEVLITQAAAPVIYTTIPELFDAATSTEMDVRVTFGDWVVSAVHNNNAYLTDNQGHGLIIYASGHGFLVNDVLTGTVSCKLVLYRGSAELTNLTTSTEGLTVTSGGTVTAQTIAISNLGGVNTGALLSFEGLTYNGTALVDGSSNAITPYTTLYSGTFENGKSYNVTGIYVQYNDNKEILPRSAADIEEVQVQHQDYDLTVTLNDNVSAIYVFDAADQSNPLIADGAAGNVQVADATQVLVSPDVASGYALGSLTVDGVDVTEDMNEGSYTFTMPTHAVTITATAVPVKTYTLASTITSGKHYIIVNNDAGRAMGEQASNNRQADGVTISGQTASVASEANVVEFVIYGPDADGYFTIYDGNGYLYAASSSSNYLKTQTTNDDNGRWSISFGEGGVASIVAQGSNTRNVMQYNPNNGNPIFACYASDKPQKPVYLYEKDGEAALPQNVTLNANGYATFASTSPVDFTDAETTGGYTAWAVTGISGTEVTFTQIDYAVAAGTGVFLKGTASSDVKPVYTATGTTVSGNKLVGITTATDVTAGEYFGLKGNEFVPVNAGTVPAGKALLPATEVPSEIKAFTFVFNGADGIQTVETVSAEDAKAIFNLAGQRMNRMQRGVNIVNGKKVLVK